MSPKKKEKLLSISLISLSAILIGIYMFQTIDSGRTNYLINEKESKLFLLEEETSDLKLAVSKTSNLNNLEEKVKEMGYAKMGKIDFINISSSSVAIND